MINILIILIGKLLSKFSKIFNLGNGSTWPGHIALKLNPNFISDSIRNSKTKVILVVGTNGKTTTSKLLQTILEHNQKKVFLNTSGANLLNGAASSIILNSSFVKLDADFAIFELDENAFPKFLEKVEPDYIVGLNLFRDQLDRYGEIDTISKRWKKSVSKLIKTKLILNADDAQIAFLGKNTKLDSFYFGLNEKNLEKSTMQHASDSILCPNCGAALNFKAYYFSHLGIWRCDKCGFKRPNKIFSEFTYLPLRGTYAKYDVLAAVLLAKIIGFNDSKIESALKKFQPAFGRQEVINYNGKQVELFLSKNPISLNESLSTAQGLKAKTLLIILNDNIPDGLDVSWIWDVDFEQILSKNINIVVSGIRAYDMAIRLKYAGFYVHITDTIENAIDVGLKDLENNEKLFILPNYSAMLEVRKILTGKKIL
ncbi:MAG: MurT ligase domain-containing protein [Patescibacteria group bacterium]|nr:MurT ligase domain-containing protein [Patescibacteria group bacterium]